jgi:hypothetical protein
MANYGGRQPNNTAYIKNFVFGNTAVLWNSFQYNPTGSTQSIGVLTPASPSYNNVNIPGNLYVGGSIINPSDINIKDNIDNINLDKTNKLLNIEPKQFTFKNDKSNQLHYGFIAQDFEKEIPDLIFSKPDLNNDSEVKAINYLEIIPLLVHKIQIMQKEIDELKEMNKLNKRDE